MLRTATRRFRVAEIVNDNILMQGRGRGAAQGRSGRGGRGRKQQYDMSSTTSSSDDSANYGTNNRRRQNQKRPERGSGRYNNIARSTPSNQTSYNKPINIESTNFQSIFHNKLCQAAKYKVHAPQCSCPKVVMLRQRYESTKQIKNKDTNEAAITRSGNIGGYSNDQIQFDIDGKITHQLSQLDITSPNSKNDDNNNQFDNLIVLPDTKGSNPSIYSCTNTNLLTFQKNGIECEQKLTTEIFGNTSTTTDKVHLQTRRRFLHLKSIVQYVY